jgi:enoyl-CoA hydratase
MRVKDSGNTASDAMGFTEALRHAYHIHHLGHAHRAARNDDKYPCARPRDVPHWRDVGCASLSRPEVP